MYLCVYRSVLKRSGIQICDRWIVVMAVTSVASFLGTVVRGIFEEEINKED